jgi:hypothetical protein
LHQGQFEGYRKRVSVHLQRKPKEDVDKDIQKFYNELVECLKLPVVHNGEWKLLECARAWEDNWTAGDFIAFSWTNEKAGENEKPVYVVVNYSPHQSQCYVKISRQGIETQTAGLKDFDIRISSGSDLKFLELTEN